MLRALKCASSPSPLPTSATLTPARRSNELLLRWFSVAKLPGCYSLRRQDGNVRGGETIGRQPRFQRRQDHDLSFNPSQRERQSISAMLSASMMSVSPVKYGIRLEISVRPLNVRVSRVVIAAVRGIVLHIIQQRAQLSINSPRRVPAAAALLI